MHRTGAHRSVCLRLRRLVLLLIGGLSVQVLLTPAAAMAGSEDQAVDNEPGNDKPGSDNNGNAGDAARAPANGFRLNSVTSSVGYSSLDTNYSTGNAIGGYGDGYSSSLSLSGGYTRVMGSSTFSAIYAPSYLMTGGEVHFRSFDQRLMLSLIKRPRPNWTISLGSQDEDVSLPQLLFNPPAVSAALAGDPAQGATGGPASLMIAPYAITIYGQRVLTLAGFFGVSYRYSSRLNFTGTGGYSQARSLQGDTGGGVAALVSRSRAGTGSFNATYSLTPRTYLGGEVSYRRADGNLLSYQGTTASGSIGRKLSKRWSAGGSLGVGYFLSPGAGVSWVAGATLAYRGREYSVLFKADRDLGNGYGLGTRSTTDCEGTWSWNPGSRAWSMFTSGSEQQLSGDSFATLRFWLVNTGLTRQLSERAAMTFSYVRTGNAGLPAGSYSNLASSAVRLTLTWIPSRRDLVKKPGYQQSN